MTIVVPYTDLHPQTAAAVPDAQFVRIEHADHYRQLLRELWARGEAFTLVEHDVVPRTEQLAALDACPEPWCGYGYGPGDWTPVFGCIRFRADLIAALPGAFDDPSWPWMQLDAKFAVYAREHGFRHHWHYPHVHHARVPHNRVSDGVYEVARIPLTRDEQIGTLEAELSMLRAALDRDVLLEGGGR